MARPESAAMMGFLTDGLPGQLCAFVSDRTDRILGVTEAAEKLGISRSTVYDWASKNTLIAWRSTKRKLNIPAAQIVGTGSVLPGLAEVVDVVGEPELAWAFLTQEWPFEATVERPLDRLSAGRIEEVLSAAAGFGASFT